MLTVSVFGFLTDAAAQNRAVAYVETGTASPVVAFQYGAAVQADMTLSKYVDIQAGLRLGNQYPSAFGTVKAGLSIFPSAKRRNWEISNSVIFSNYSPYPLNQLYYRLTGSWSCDYFRVDVGNAFLFLLGDGFFKYNLFRPLLSVKGTLRSPRKIWNLSVFARNFNRFDTHAQDRIEWGVEVPVRIDRHWVVFCESFVSTVGNFSGTGNYYNCNINLGAAFAW